jgi:hypothetical protein
MIIKRSFMPIIIAGIALVGSQIRAMESGVPAMYVKGRNALLAELREKTRKAPQLIRIAPDRYEFGDEEVSFVNSSKEIQGAALDLFKKPLSTFRAGQRIPLTTDLEKFHKLVALHERSTSQGTIMQLTEVKPDVYSFGDQTVSFAGMNDVAQWRARAVSYTPNAADTFPDDSDKFEALLKIKAESLRAMSPRFIKMPNAKVLHERLDAIGVGHFAERTQIIKRLAGEELAALGVATAVEQAMDDYRRISPNPRAFRQTEMLQPDILKALLKDSPEALNELKGHGLL